MSSPEELEELFLRHGFKDFKWINPQDIVIAQWVRMKCMFGCDEYGKCACCPPNTPAVQESRNFFHEYSQGVVFHFEKYFEKPAQRHDWTKSMDAKLLSVEREVFCAGNPKAFLLFMDSCHLCTDCAGERVKCKNKKFARPTPEAMAVDVFSTMKALGYPIKVLQNYSETTNRYALLLVR